jgi:hypothetical protein
MGEEDPTVQQGGFGATGGGADPGAAATRASRLERRVKALDRSQPRAEPTTALKLLTTDELRRALALVERAGVLPDGDVRRPDVFREASPEESEALGRWMQLCGEPLDQLEAAEELLDRMGEAHGWHSREAAGAALLLTRLGSPEASPWLVAKTAEAVVNFYDELEAHHTGGGMSGGPHPRVRGAVKRLERLRTIGRFGGEVRSDPEGREDDLLSAETAQLEGSGGTDRFRSLDARPASTEGASAGRAGEPHPVSTPADGSEPSGGRRRPWWRRWVGG